MKYRLLGKTGIEISELGFGCMSLGRNTEKDSMELIHKAVDAGVNYFDTADMYDKGANETLVGKALKPVRDKIVLATKVGNQWRADGSGWDWNPRKEYILKAVEASLKRLQTDRIDLYQLHGGTISDPIDETIEAFELLKQQGKILHYGISSIRPNVIKEYVKRSGIVSVMMQYSLLDRRPEEEILDILQRVGISVMVRGALAQGLLINKPAKEYFGHNAEEILEFQIMLNNETSEKITASQLAIQYTLKHRAVTSAVVGFRTKGQLEELLKTEKTMTLELYKKLQQSVPVNKYIEHR